MGYILDTEEIIKASWSLFQHDGVGSFELSEISPLPPAFSTKDLPGGRTQILNTRQIRRINRHPVESDADIASERISDTECGLNLNGDLDNQNDIEDDCVADVESDLGTTMPSWFWNAQSSAMWTPGQMFRDWLGLHSRPSDRLERCWWRSMKSKWGGTREWRKSRTECVHVSSA